MDDLRIIIGAAIGAGVVQYFTGRKLGQELQDLRLYLAELAAHVGFRPPPEPGKRGD